MYAFGNETMGYFYIPSATLEAESANGASDARKDSPMPDPAHPGDPAAVAVAAARAALAQTRKAAATAAADSPVPRADSPAGRWTPLGFSPFVPPSPGGDSPMHPLGENNPPGVTRTYQPSPYAAESYAAATTRARPPPNPSRESLAADSFDPVSGTAGSFLRFAAKTLAKSSKTARADRRAAPLFPAVPESGDAEDARAAEGGAKASEASSAAGGRSPGPSSSSSSPDLRADLPDRGQPRDPEAFSASADRASAAAANAAAAAAAAYNAEYAAALRAWAAANPRAAAEAGIDAEGEVAPAAARDADANDTPVETTTANAANASNAFPFPGGATGLVPPDFFPVAPHGSWSPAAAADAAAAAAYNAAGAPPFVASPVSYSPPPYSSPTPYSPQSPLAFDLANAASLAGYHHHLTAGYAGYAAAGYEFPSAEYAWTAAANPVDPTNPDGAYRANARVVPGAAASAFGRRAHERNVSPNQPNHHPRGASSSRGRGGHRSSAGRFGDAAFRSRVASRHGHALAERAGLGTNTGAVLVGSGGDGLGEATRGPRAANGMGGAGGAFRAGGAGGSGPAVGKLAGLPSKHARSGVAADPHFRGSMWHFARGEALRAGDGRESPMPDASDFDGSGLDGLDPSDARFFVIKSYSEDDVHKSIKYGCWTSTAQGNARLDAAWRCEPADAAGERDPSEGDDDVRADESADEREKAETTFSLSEDEAEAESAPGEVRGKARDAADDAASESANDSSADDSSATSRGGARETSPFRPRIILFFSVNSSGHFCGVAEMVSPIDHELRADFWQNDRKWPGCFKVAWHVVKDVPNNALRHIRLCAGDKKPVTNSRDAQEVEPAQGALVLRVFREFPAATSMLDDFAFYGAREKTRQSIRRQRNAAHAARTDAEWPRHAEWNRRGAEGHRRDPFHPPGPRETRSGVPALAVPPWIVAREKSPKPRADAAPFESAAGKEQSRAARTNPASAAADGESAAAGTRAPNPEGRERASEPESAVAAPAAALPPFKFGDDDRDQRAEERRSSPRARVAETRTAAE